jgi:hypothetical protein
MKREAHKVDHDALARVERQCFLAILDRGLRGNVTVETNCGADASALKEAKRWILARG